MNNDAFRTVKTPEDKPRTSQPHQISSSTPLVFCVVERRGERERERERERETHPCPSWPSHVTSYHIAFTCHIISHHIAFACHITPHHFACHIISHHIPIPIASHSHSHHIPSHQIPSHHLTGQGTCSACWTRSWPETKQWWPARPSRPGRAWPVYV